MSFALSVTQSAPSCTEHELVAAVRRGDDRAFEELYARYRSRIGTYIFGMVGDHARAEDITQEVFISALRRLRDTERPIAFKAWIYEIARNACIDEFRRTKRVQEVPLAGEHESPRGGRELLSSAPTPDAAVENKQSLAHLRGAFHGLSENHHKIIVMRELEGLSYSQIGERLGMSRPMVESTLFRARRRLTEEYDELASGRRCQHVQTVIDTTEQRALPKLGIRERRQLARHLSHCQPCRRHARMAGVDDSILKAPTLIGKIAALLPIPWLRWRRGGGRGNQEDSVSISGSHSVAALQSLQAVVRFADPASPSVGAGRAVAAIAAIALAAVGGGVLTVASSQDGHSGATAPARAHVKSTSGPGAGIAPPPAVRRSIQHPSAGYRSVQPVRGRASTTASTTASTQGSSKPGHAPAHAAASSTATRTGRQVNHVLSGATSAATGGATHIGGIQLPHVPVRVPAPKPPSIHTVVKLPKLPSVHIVVKLPKLPSVHAVVKLPKLGATKVPKVNLPNPLPLLSSPPKVAPPPPQPSHISTPHLRTVTAPLPKLPDPTKLLPH